MTLGGGCHCGKGDQPARSGRRLKHLKHATPTPCDHRGSTQDCEARVRARLVCGLGWRSERLSRERSP
jgi:hypothetical protein